MKRKKKVWFCNFYCGFSAFVKGDWYKISPSVKKLRVPQGAMEEKIQNSLESVD